MKQIEVTLEEAMQARLMTMWPADAWGAHERKIAEIIIARIAQSPAETPRAKVDPYGSEFDTEALHRATVEASAIAVKAGEEHGDFSSMHEAYGVLAEEVAELFDAVRLQESYEHRKFRIHREALDVAAVALRIAEQTE